MLLNVMRSKAGRSFPGILRGNNPIILDAGDNVHSLSHCEERRGEVNADSEGV